ncbi:MAG: Xaa-Pro aminopeptidase [bacterium]|nr:Xaa-Pro aminopeptidase [bacterium]
MALKSNSLCEADFHKRRERLLKLLPDNATAIIPAADEKVFSRDVHYPFRQNSNLLYFTGLKEPLSALILEKRKGKSLSTIVVREKDAARELWQGVVLGVKKAQKLFHVDKVVSYSELFPEFQRAVSGQQNIYIDWNANSEVDSFIVEGCRDISSSPANICSLAPLIAGLRICKSNAEIALHRKACQLSARSFNELTSLLPEMNNERHVATTLEAIFYKYGADGLAFNTIAAFGDNATCLHHSPGKRTTTGQSSVLIDAGASFGGYAADITRVYPLKHSHLPPEVKEVHQLVLQTLKAATIAVNPGTTLGEIRKIAVLELASGLKDLGFKNAGKSNLQQTVNRYFPHSIGHFLGLDVHDVYPPATVDNGRGSDIPLKTNMIVTIEPGLYFPTKDDNVPKRLRGIGIRLEDDVLVKKNGHEVLTGDALFSPER